MILDPQNDFERLQNAVATQIMSQTAFQNLKMPDGSKWEALTEDEGDIEFLFTNMIAVCGLAIVVHAPTGKTSAKTRNLPGPRFDPLAIVVQVSESVLMNRSEAGTKVRLQTAASIVRRCLHIFTPTNIAGLKAPLMFMEAVKDRDRHPETGALVASVLCSFDAILNEDSLTIQ